MEEKVRLQLRVDREIRKALKIAAADREQTVSKTLEEAILTYLEQSDADN